MHVYESGNTSKGNKPIVVAIGLTAGELAAVEHLLRAMPVDLGVALLLSPCAGLSEDLSLLDLLSDYTEMPVVNTQDRCPLLANHVYISPADRYLSVKDGTICHEHPIEPGGTPIDHLFLSLAAGDGEQAIGIVLSARSNDGIEGLKSISARGGVSMVASPCPGAYLDVLLSSTCTRAAVSILPPAAMPALLCHYLQLHFAGAKATGDLGENPPAAQQAPHDLSKENRALRARLNTLERDRDELANLLASTGLATLLLDTHGCIQRFTPSAKRLFKLIDRDVGRPINDIGNQFVGAMDLCTDTERVIEQQRGIENEVCDTQGNWYIRRLTPYRGENNDAAGVVVTFSDITALKQTQDRLVQSEALYHSLYENTPAMYFTLDANFTILSVNEFGATQLGSQMDALVGANFLALHIDRHYVKDIIGKAIRNAGAVQLWESKMLGGTRADIWVRCLARAMQIDNAVRIFVVCQDISAEKRLSDELEFRATHDFLTGLLNRREFDKALTLALSKPIPEEIGHSILYIDLNRFKLVNDTSGHEAGDQVLKAVALLLRKHTRSRDVLARVGGDEFGVLMECCSAIEAQHLAKALIKAIEEHDFVVREHHFALSCAIGIVEIHDGMLTPQEVFRRADVACYVARDEGYGSVRIFDETDNNDQRKRAEMRWGGLIRRAIADDQVDLICEPIVGREDSRIIGFEFLSRVRENATLQNTGALIAAAERYGLAPDFDRHVVKKALHLLDAQLPRLAPLELMSINISGQSIGRSDFADNILAMVEASAIPPQKLCFEITETATISNLQNAVVFVKKIRAVGCRVAIDDFGSGLASFHYLNSLPCDLVKIDGSFVQDILTGESGLALVAAIDNIAKLYGVETCAEWVENEGTDFELRRIGVNYRQGHLFGRELTLEQLLAIVEAP